MVGLFDIAGEVTRLHWTIGGYRMRNVKYWTTVAIENWRFAHRAHIGGSPDTTKKLTRSVMRQAAKWYAEERGWEVDYSEARIYR